MEKRPREIVCYNDDIAYVDSEDFEELNQHLWYSTKIGVMRNEADSPYDRTVYLHREVMGEPEGLCVGFLDGDKRNCCKDNLFVFQPGKKREALARLRGQSTR